MAIAATKIIDARVRAEEIWADSQAVKSRQYMPKMKLTQTILGQQTADFSALKDRRNCGKVKVTWKALCQGTATLQTGITKINSFMCNISGTPSDTAVQEYTMDSAIQSSGFTITDDLCQNVYQLDELIADGLLMQHKEVVEKLGAFIIAKLVSFKGANNYLGNGLITAAAGNLYKIAGFDAVASTMVPYLLRAADNNEMGNPILLQGDALYNNLYRDNKQQDTQNDNGYMKMWNDLNIVEDFKTFNAASMNNDFLFIDSGAVALVTKYSGTEQPQELGWGEYLTTMPLLGGILVDAQGEQILVDVYQKRQKVVIETVGGKDRCVWGTTYQLELKLGMFLNPVACNNNYTGIIHFQKDDTLTPKGVSATWAKVPPEAMGVYQAIR